MIFLDWRRRQKTNVTPLFARFIKFQEENHAKNSPIIITAILIRSSENIWFTFKERDSLSALGFQYNAEHDIWIMPIVKNIEHFQYWVSVYPFYKNVQKEGVTLYETA